MPKKKICYRGPGAVVKNGNHNLKQVRMVIKKQKRY